MQVIQQASHPGNNGLFPNTVWGLSSSFLLRPATLFPRLTSVTCRHYKAQFTRGTSKAGSTPMPSPGIKTRRKKEPWKDPGVPVPNFKPPDVWNFLIEKAEMSADFMQMCTSGRIRLSYQVGIHAHVHAHKPS